MCHRRLIGQAGRAITCRVAGRRDARDGGLNENEQRKSIGRRHVYNERAGDPLVAIYLTVIAHVKI